MAIAIPESTNIAGLSFCPMCLGNVSSRRRIDVLARQLAQIRARQHARAARLGHS